MTTLNSSGTSASVWIERDDLILPSTAPAYPKLDTDIETDVLVIGGGIAGLQIAYELLSSGITKVVVVEDGKIGSGETGRTTGQLSADGEYNEYLQLHGAHNTAQIAAAQQAGIDRLEAISQKHNIDCDFRRVPGYMFHGLPVNAKGYEVKTLQSIWEAASATGTLDIELVDDANIKGFKSGRTIKYNKQGIFHPTKYIKGLAQVITGQLGGAIYEQTHINDYKDSSAMQRGVTATTVEGKTIRADHLVMATNVPLQKLEIIDRCEPYRTYALACKIPNEAVSVSGEPALWWDLADPYHYVRSTPHKEEGYSLLIVGGEDEKVGQHNDQDERYKRLAEWTRERWTGALEVEYQWSGQVIDTMDGIALIGRDSGTKNIYIHTGDNGDGLTYAAIGGIVLRDVILGRSNEWAKLFEPGRQFSLSHLKSALQTIPDYITSNLSDQKHYAKWVTRCRKTMSDIEDLVPGEGEVVRDGVSPVAVYKDDNGGIHKMTAVCPHLKGIVVWNKAEKTFDCPIHGSRFTCRGEVINGPAKGNLENQKDRVTA